ncbi:MAG TPA: MFS transporter [Ideonella sp.]|uniref:MFS transporter n=1 Tax=Ideonella sp. TaxID=1929293 RepID=UPI002B790B50|nr:MFS transporter [Ideonella sp.]HSI50895.1 MFS transporter [Ideonella sp.]
MTAAASAQDAQHDKLAMRRALPAVIGALVGVHASMAATRVTASLLLLHLGYPEWMVGTLLSLFALAPLPLSLWAGRQADRHGMHRTLGIGVVMGAGGALLAAISQHPVALAMAALTTGGAVAVAAVGIQREAGRLAHNALDLKRVFSWVSLGPALSNALAPVVVGLLIDHVGYRSGFVFAALLPLASWAFAGWVPRQPAPPAGAGAEQAPAWHLLKSPQLRALLLVNLALSSCWDAHSFAIPVLGHVRAMSASSIGLVLGAFAAAATVVRFLISRWADKLDERLALRSAMGLATAVCAVYVWLPGTPGMLVGSALLGLALGSVQPMVLAMLHQVTPSDRHGQALGLRMLVTNGATVFMPTLFGLLAAATLPAAPMWLMGSIVLLAQWPARRVVPGAGH